MALSPPKASNTGLRASHAAERDRTASALIQPIVMAWIQRIRRSVVDAGAGSAEFIEEDYDTLAEQRDRERLRQRDEQNRHHNDRDDKTRRSPQAESRVAARFRLHEFILAPLWVV